MAVTNLYHSTAWSGSVSAGGAGSTLQDSWVDAQGSRWSVVGGVLTCAAGSSFNASFLQRPSGENQQDQRIVVGIPAGQNGSAAPMAVLRWVDSSHFYFFWFDAGNGTFSVRDAALNTIGSNVSFVYNSVKAYEIDCTCEGVSPTTITAVLRNVTDVTTVGTVGPATDSAAGVQTSGGYGLSGHSSPAFTLGQVDLYNTGGGAAVSDALVARRRPPMHLLAR